MRKAAPVFLLLLLLAGKTSLIFPQEDDWDKHLLTGAGETAKHGLIAVGELLLPKLVVTSINRFIFDASWAFPTKHSIHRSFTTYWIWEDTDDFVVNQIGHPYQGHYSFSAGRVNGFGFYQSIPFNAFGGFMWEAFGESNWASVNDLITTTTGSVAVGEIFYRLYIEACEAGIPWPIAFLINPIAGFHRLVTSWEPPKAGRNLYSIQYHLGGGYAATHYSVSNHHEEIFSFSGPMADFGAKIVYGNPFEQDTNVPFRHFEITINFGFDLGNYSHLRVISDGYLFSFSPVYTETDTMSTGLTMHFDFQALGEFVITDSTINQYSNALDWTIKYQHLFSPDTAFQLKAHAGLTFFGAAKYFANTEVRNDYDHIKTDYNTFGSGFNSKLFTTLEYKWGRLEASVFYYVLFTFPASTHFSRGITQWLFTDFGYYHHVTRHLSLGLTYLYVMERGYYNDGYPDTRRSNQVITLLAAWNF